MGARKDESAEARRERRVFAFSPFRAFAPSWPRFGAEAQVDLKLALLAVLCLQVLRIALVCIFRDGLDPATGLGPVASALAGGLRYDARTAFYVAAPGLLGSLVCGFVDAGRAARRIRLLSGGLFLCLFPPLAVVTIGYISEYGDQFNHFLFGVIYDDFGAVLRTIWNEHHVVLQLGAAAAAAWALLRAQRRWIQRPWCDEDCLRRRLRGRGLRAAVTVLLAAACLIAARGGFARVPVQFRDRDVTQDAFLNRLVLNPVEAFRYAVKEHRDVNRKQGFKNVLGEEGIRGALAGLFPGRTIGPEMDALLLRHAKGPKGAPARHVFVLLMESFDAWPLLPLYRPLRLLPECERLGAGGVLVLPYLSASSGTGTSLSALVSGLHDSGVPVNYLESSRNAYPTATAAAFRRLGYRTRLFYGGYLSWERLGDFAKDQGFEECYGRAHIPHPRQVNEWGVDDRSLFDLVLSKATDDRPSFNLVLTTNYHPPYNFDFRSEGWVPRELPPELAKLADGRLTDAMMAHLWYSDRCMGDFADTVTARLPKTLVAVTGDHFSRKFLNQRPGLYEGSAVPLLLFGPQVLAGVRVPGSIAGSHLDLGPTLVELSAPRGFPYHSLGEDLLDAAREPVGFGRRMIIGPDFIAPLDDSRPALPLPSPVGPGAEPDLERLRQRYRRLIGVSWWRAVHGAALPPETHEPHATAQRRNEKTH